MLSSLGLWHARRMCSRPTRCDLARSEKEKGKKHSMNVTEMERYDKKE